MSGATISVEKYVGQSGGITIVTDCDCDASGTVPASDFSALGLAIVQSVTAAQVRGLIAAAASGANNDITQLLGLTTPLSVAQGGTGANNPASARLNLGIITSLSGLPVQALAANYTATAVDAVYLLNSAGGAFTLEVPRALSNAGATQVLLAIKISADANPITIADDLAAVKFAVVSTGGFALIVCAGSTTYAGGTT